MHTPYQQAIITVLHAIVILLLLYFKLILPPSVRKFT